MGRQLVCGEGGFTRKKIQYGWIAPTYNVAERGIEAFRMIADGFVKVVGRMPTRVEFEGSAGPVRVRFLSADNPDNIRGYGFQGIVVDEAAMIPQDVWNYVLRPTIAQTLGWAVFVSTPKGRNWFYDFYTRGCDPEEKEYASFRFPSSASPFFPGSEWEDAKRTLPSDVFRQEYEAEFLEVSAGVFRGIEQCLLTVDEHGWTRIGGEDSSTTDGHGQARTGKHEKICAFLGHSKQAIRWQIWSALLLYILLRFQAWASKWTHSFARLFTMIRSVIWERFDLADLLNFYGTAGGPMANAI